MTAVSAAGERRAAVGSSDGASGTDSPTGTVVRRVETVDESAAGLAQIVLLRQLKSLTRYNRKKGRCRTPANARATGNRARRRYSTRMGTVTMARAGPPAAATHLEPHSAGAAQVAVQTCRRRIARARERAALEHSECATRDWLPSGLKAEWRRCSAGSPPTDFRLGEPMSFTTCVPRTQRRASQTRRSGPSTA